jgi:hypothetical protein
MATNTPGTRTTNRPDDQTTVTGRANTPTAASTGVGGVEVYDNNGDVTTDSSLHRSASLAEDRAPVETRSSGSMLTWIISAVVLIALIYFLLQILF